MKYSDVFKGVRDRQLIEQCNIKESKDVFYLSINIVNRRV